MTDLQVRLNKAIEEEKFDFLEISGFKVNPKLSLLAGALIGYRLAIRDSSKLLNPSLKGY